VRVFVIGTGRCGTRTFAQACKRIQNFTSAHESHSRRSIGDLDYPDGHIEIDHHLSWGLPLLLDRYPASPDTLYVHLLRERAACVASLSRRIDMDMFAALSSFVTCNRRTPELRRRAAEYFYDSRNAAIDLALRKPSIGSGYALSVAGNHLTVFVESLPEVWPLFWEVIGAEGDMEAAMAECRKRYNRGLECKGEQVREERP